MVMTVEEQAFEDVLMCSAFLMEGITDWCVIRTNERAAWEDAMGKDQYFLAVGIPVAKLMASACQYCTYHKLWDGAWGVFHYDVTNLVGMTLAKGGFTGESLVAEICTLTLDCMFGTGKGTDRAYHEPRIAAWMGGALKALTDSGVVLDVQVR